MQDKHRLYLVEVEDKIELAHVAEVMVQNLHKQMDALKIGELIVSHVHTHGEIQASISPVDDLVRLELHQVPQG